MGYLLPCIIWQDVCMQLRLPWDWERAGVFPRATNWQAHFCYSGVLMMPCAWGPVGCSFVLSESGLPLLFRGIHRWFGKQSCSFCIWHQVHLHGRCFVLRKQNVFVSLHKLYWVKKLVALTAYWRWASIFDMSCISCCWGFSFQTKEIKNDYLEKGFWVTRGKKKKYWVPLLGNPATAIRDAGLVSICIRDYFFLL